MKETLAQNPVLLLFLVASIGYFLGSIKVRGGALGVSAILFTGLFVGAMDARFQIPEIIFVIGLSIYIYSLGLTSGPAFFKSYKKNGFRDFIFIVAMMIVAGLISVGLWWSMGFSAATITGIYTGSTTNTAALAGVIDIINEAGGVQADQQISDMVIGYSFSYPMGVLGSMIAIIFMERLLRISYENEAENLRSDYPIDEGLTSKTIKITNKEIEGVTLRQLLKDYGWKVVFGRVYQNNEIKLVNYDTTFQINDIVMLVGGKDDIDLAVNKLGEVVTHPLTYDRNAFDVRSIMVSEPRIAGRSIADLRINEQFNAVITRIRRGDVEMLAKGETILELGDRIRIMANRQDLKELSRFFGDSYEKTSRVNLFSFGLGIGLGLFLGTIAITISESFTFRLGYAGGPLIVGLILGALRRTGPIVWTLPYSANITLQQLGLILLLATIGVRSGQSFIQSFSADGLWIFAASSAISILTAMSILFVGFKWLKMPFSLLMGMVANQPAILDFATTRSKNVIPNYGYTMMLPIALISKIIIAQILFTILSS